VRRWVLGLAVAAMVVVCVGVVVVEVVGRRIAENVATSELQRQGIDDATVSIGTWWRPSVLSAILLGDLDRVRVRLEAAQVSGVDVLEADYDLEGLQVDVDVLSGTVAITDLSSGSFRVLVDPATFGAQLGVEVTADDTTLLIGPGRSPATLRMEGDQVVIDSDYLREQGVDGWLVVADRQLLPCDPMPRVAFGLVELSCTGDRLPGILDSSLGQPLDVAPPPAQLEPPATLERDAPATTAPTAGAPTTSAPTTTTTGSDDEGG
jgi:hypothetical protein